MPIPRQEVIDNPIPTSRGHSYCIVMCEYQPYIIVRLSSIEHSIMTVQCIASYMIAVALIIALHVNV